ncbi:MAG: type IV secretory system conjugative DNA transfer family protein [Christensenellales bacterium]
MKIAKKILLFGVILIFCFAFGYLANMFISNKFVFEFKISTDLLLSSKTWLYTFFLFAVFIIFFLFAWQKGIGKNPKKIMQASEKDKDIYTGLEQAHFQTPKEIENNFKTVEYNKLSNTEIEGIPIIAEENKKGYEITFAKPAHTLVIGTTGSGKTTTFINPTVQILSNTLNKPSMLISDPKGELFALHAKSLIKRGYDVKVLDLRNPYCSIRWNPLERPFEMYQEMLSLDDKVRVNEEEGYYVFEDKIYYDEDEKNAAVQVRKQEIFDEVYEDLNDICSVLCPVTNKSEPIWESGAKNFILAICLAMLEDSENERLGMTKEKFNFYNIMKIATNTQNDCEDLIEYFNHRSPISKSVSLAKQVLDASDKTRGSYLSTIFDKLSMFSDMSICSLTSANEINFGEIVNKPTALFLQIPDEKETRHTLAAMVILQAYKSLVAKANTYPDLSLPRCVYFLLDEFGNLPKVHKLEQMITVGRSRKIWLALVVQSYAQLAKVYDEKSADIIKSNCNIQIFIGTTDLKTIDEFSKKCGNFSIIQRNVSFSSSNDNVGSSVSVKERPLIYPTELQQLNSPNNMGNAIVNVFGFPPLKSKYTPSYKSKYFVLEKTNQLLSQGKYFNEEKVFYNMLERNKSFGTKKVENRKSDLTPFIEMFKIQIEKFDFESLNAFDYKLEILKALDDKNFAKINSLFNKLVKIAEETQSEDFTEIKNLSIKAEQMMRLSKL